MKARSRLYRIEGIVLSRRDQGEADRVVRMLTADGIVDLLAKGIRKPHSRKAGHLELFSRSQVLASRVKNSWDILSQAEAMMVRRRLQEDFERATYARYIAELVIRFFEGETDLQLYHFVDQVFAHLEEVAEPMRFIRWVEPRLLTLAGFRPTWDACVGEREGALCEAELHPQPSDRRPYGIDPAHGGALCPDCFKANREMRAVQQLSPSALSWLQAFQRREYEDVSQYDFPAQTATELSHVMEHYIVYHLEWRPAILTLMQELGRRE